MQINLYVKAKLAGTDEGKILDDIHGICYVREGKPCAGKRDVLNRCPASTNTKKISRRQCSIPYLKTSSLYLELRLSYGLESSTFATCTLWPTPFLPSPPPIKHPPRGHKIIHPN